WPSVSGFKWSGSLLRNMCNLLGLWWGEGKRTSDELTESRGSDKGGRILALFPYYAHLLSSAGKRSAQRKTNQQPAIGNKPCRIHIRSTAPSTPSRGLRPVQQDGLASYQRGRVRRCHRRC